MMNIDQIREALGDRNLSEVARRVGMTPAYLSAIKSGTRRNPSYSTVKRLSDYLERHK